MNAVFCLLLTALWASAALAENVREPANPNLNASQASDENLARPQGFARLA
jgi:hypothetical protein